MAKFVMHEPAFQHMIRALGGTVGRDMKRRGEYIRTQARAAVGVRTGLLRANIHSTLRQSRRGISVRVGSPMPYALYHHEGTKPHIISAQPGRFLTFTYRGRRFRLKSVAHRGHGPNKYLTAQLPAAVTI